MKNGGERGRPCEAEPSNQAASGSPEPPKEPSPQQADGKLILDLGPPKLKRRHVVLSATRHGCRPTAIHSSLGPHTKPVDPQHSQCLLRVKG
jgi:hypothetical protein